MHDGRNKVCNSILAKQPGKFANSVNPDETAHNDNEPPDLNLHYLSSNFEFSICRNIFFFAFLQTNILSSAF